METKTSRNVLQGVVASVIIILYILAGKFIGGIAASYSKSVSSSHIVVIWEILYCLIGAILIRCWFFLTHEKCRQSIWSLNVSSVLSFFLLLFFGVILMAIDHANFVIVLSSIYLIPLFSALLFSARKVKK